MPVLSLTAAALGSLLFQSCEHDAPQIKESQPDDLVKAAFVLTVEVEELRPLSRALNGRSFGEDTLDDLQHRIALVRDLLSDEWPMTPDRTAAAGVALEFAGLKYDLVWTDLQATARGISGVVRSNCNLGIKWTNHAAAELARDWRWAVDHPADVDRALAVARRSRDNVMAAAPIANVMRAGVTAAEIASATSSVGALVRGGRLGLERVIGWLRGARGAPRLALAGAGAASGIVILAEGETLVLTETEILALASAGKLSGLALSLLYLARGQLHHICTNKNWVSAGGGGPWSPIFEEIFEGADIEFDAPANLVEVEGHVGPHPTEYHQAVFRRLQSATEGLVPHTAEYRRAVLRTLDALAKEIRTPGTRLHQLVTGALR